MKIKFYVTMFLLIITIPFFLLKTKNTKTDNAIFVEAKSNIESRDTIKLIEVIDGEEKEYFIDFEIDKGQRAYFYKDTLGFNLIAGFLGGYNLLIEMVGTEYTSKLINSNCTWRAELKIKEQRLQFEDFKLVHNRKLKGEYFCIANHKTKFTDQVEKVKIKGYFEFNLVDADEERKLWE